MSFVARTTFRSIRAAPVARFSISARAQKSPVDTAKDTLKSADRVVSDAAISGIEAGQKATQKVKEATGYNAKEASGKAQGTAEEMTGKAKGTASEMAGNAQGTAHEMTGKAKGKVEEMKGKMS